MKDDSVEDRQSKGRERQLMDSERGCGRGIWIGAAAVTSAFLPEKSWRQK